MSFTTCLEGYLECECQKKYFDPKDLKNFAWYNNGRCAANEKMYIDFRLATRQFYQLISFDQVSLTNVAMEPLPKGWSFQTFNDCFYKLCCPDHTRLIKNIKRRKINDNKTREEKCQKKITLK